MSSTKPERAAIGVDVGGTKIAFHLGDGTGWSVEERIIPTPVTEGATAILAAIIQECRQIQEAASQQGIEVVAVGVGSAGQIDTERGIVLDANENLPGWQGIPISATISAALGIPVYVDNDVKVLALAESHIGAGRPYDHILYVAVGTGIGGAIVIHNRIWHGAHGSAGEIGYLYTGTGRTLEECAAGPPLAQAYANATGKVSVTLYDVAQYAGDGDETAVRVIEQGAEILGRVLAPVLCLLDPQALIIGGGVPDIGDLWWQPFLDALQMAPLASARNIPVKRAELGTSAGVLGASLMALNRLESQA
ncbi:ROK family protein [Phototrophicus methaneseepsis]|uniref:ROK family protein n=1 Tax=Phototrophicus methaneseepsis TaxID=2710758 RepID=A0A7S8E7Z3_9CHLR|nr:ROK family protein [Phototrophicus methaneseepsis]QPC82024.1 ROK family protein [Phototrophicus methaneseepsis]